MSLLANLSIRGKILGLAVVATIGYAVMMLISSSALSTAADRLKQLQQVYYPVLAHSTTNAVQLERMAEAFTTAATIGEQEALLATDNLHSSMQQAFAAQRERLPAQAALIDQLAQQTSAYHRNARSLAAGLIDGSLPMEQVQQRASAVSAELQAVKKALDSFQADSEAAFTALVEQANSDAARANIINLLLGVLILAVVISGAIYVASQISRSVRRVARSLEAIAQGEGDLTKVLRHDGNDELAELVTGFNDFIGKLRSAMRATIDSVSQLQATTSRLSHSSRTASEQINAQGRAIDQTTTALSEMFMTVKHVAEHAAEASHAATTADGEARNGSAVVNRTIAAINDLAGEVETTARTISQLESYTNNVGSILATIRGIAEQTNLLALNAAIEAARAGEQGRGFAVVADEVRTLASRTQQSTHEIQKVLEELQHAAKGAVQAMGRGTDMARNSVEQSDSAGNSLRAITDRVSAITIVNSQIATATEEQAQTSQLIQGYVHEIHQMAQDAIAATGDLGTVSQALEQISAQLNQVTGQFRV